MLFSKGFIAFAVFSLWIVPLKSQKNLLLDNYLPVSMQALQYYLDHLQYEPLPTTTIEPLFSPDDFEDFTKLTTTSKSTTVGWWWTTTTTTAKPSTTRHHKPGLFAPEPTKQQTDKDNYYSPFNDALKHHEVLNDLTVSLMRDIQTEIDHYNFDNDVEHLDNFMRLYDDNYGRPFSNIDTEATQDYWTTGKKRLPPTKPYVDFLFLYDLLKRDAKAAKLNKSEGYSKEFLKDLQELSDISAARQLYTILKRLLDRGDVKRSDVVSRVKDMIKELADPESKTAKALRFIPALKFLA